jgi:hypothetical protein
MAPDDLTDAMLARTLPKAEWTHRGHVLACATLVRRLGAAEALVVLRRAIPAYNVSTGGENTDHAGYHETLTCYFAWAVARALDRDGELEAVLADPLVAVDAPLRFWSRERLFSVAARRTWVPPDLCPADGPDVPRLLARTPPRRGPETPMNIGVPAHNRRQPAAGGRAARTAHL